MVGPCGRHWGGWGDRGSSGRSGNGLPREREAVWTSKSCKEPFRRMRRESRGLRLEDSNAAITRVLSFRLISPGRQPLQRAVRMSALLLFPVPPLVPELLSLPPAPGGLGVLDLDLDGASLSLPGVYDAPETRGGNCGGAAEKGIGGLPGGVRCLSLSLLRLRVCEKGWRLRGGLPVTSEGKERATGGGYLRADWGGWRREGSGAGLCVAMASLWCTGAPPLLLI
mmetsp:Transcript_37113/g.73036  ORF Transcript_37113/g.73036 Transcript_37113/m.73036 type:complete len:225 (-) Transcript_37113:1641-2315(-)